MTDPEARGPRTGTDEKTAIDTIRTLSLDAVQAANSGHPGTALALAPVAYVLGNRFLRYDPDPPIWANRDRFVLAHQPGERHGRRLS